MQKICHPSKFITLTCSTKSKSSVKFTLTFLTPSFLVQLQFDFPGHLAFTIIVFLFMMRSCDIKVTLSMHLYLLNEVKDPTTGI